MRTNLVSDGHPVYLFEIDGRKYYVRRFEVFGYVKLKDPTQPVVVFAPADISYQRAARMVAHTLSLPQNDPQGVQE